MSSEGIGALVERLLKLAEKATPGPWRHYRQKLRPNFGGIVNEVQCRQPRKPIVQWSGFDNSDRSEAKHASNARYIAACSPDNIRRLATALVAQEAEIAALRAKVERYEARLEIDHCYVMVDGNPELERRDVPPEERETWPDGITCRDETIRLLEEQIAALTRKEG